MSAKVQKRFCKDAEAVDIARRTQEMRDLLGPSRVYPLTAPGMPFPGIDFIRAATSIDEADTSFDDKAAKKLKARRKKPLTEEQITALRTQAFAPGKILKELHRKALRDPTFQLSVRGGGEMHPVQFVPGHLWGYKLSEFYRSRDAGEDIVSHVDGPRTADVFVLGKMPGAQEISYRRNLVGPSGTYLARLLDDLGFPRVGPGGYLRWYVTNLCKFAPPNDAKDLKSDWIADCLPLLHQELRIVRPKFILCLGADASKALLGKQATVDSMEGRAADFTFDTRLSWDDEPAPHACKVVTVVHPAYAMSEPSQVHNLMRGLRRWKEVLAGSFRTEEADLDHRTCINIRQANALFKEICNELEGTKRSRRIIAVDAEWEGRHPANKGSWLRTVQISWASKKAACFVLRNTKGKVTFIDAHGKPAIRRLGETLTALVRDLDVRVCGHFFASDMEWLQPVGFDLLPNYEVPVLDEDGVEPWDLCRKGRGGLDTAFMAHALDESLGLGLDKLALTYAECPPYWQELEKWVKRVVAEKKIKRADLTGYGECPDEILIPYGNYDADVTRRIAVALLPQLKEDKHGLPCWKPYWESMLVQPVILELYQKGIGLDRERFFSLLKSFQAAIKTKKTECIEAIGWPINLNSTFQISEFLFGDAHNGTRASYDVAKRLRPEGALSLNLRPLFTTDKPPKPWAEVEQEGRTLVARPSTSRMALAILANENPAQADHIGRIRDYRFLKKPLDSILCLPNDIDKNSSSKGLWRFIDDDDRVRSRFYNTAETGRWKSAKFNLQNVSKTRDKDYSRILGDSYKHKMRSMFMAPSGKVLLEFDYKGAELLMAAIQSCDEAMIDHCLRNQLADDDPNFYDIHSQIAVMAFQLKCDPTKKGLESIGKTYLRNTAKTVIFGLMFGRGARAISLASREEQVSVSEDEAQALIDAVFKMYPHLQTYFQRLQERGSGEYTDREGNVITHMTHAFGRHRRFPQTNDRKKQGDFGREMMNFPIQGGVASVLNRGLAYLRHWRDHVSGVPDMFDFCLQIHDAAMLVTAPEYVADLLKIYVPACMSKSIPIYPADLNGRILTSRGGPYYMGLDYEISEHWGEKITKARCRELGIPEQYGSGSGTVPASLDAAQRKPRRVIVGG